MTPVLKSSTQNEDCLYPYKQNEENMLEDDDLSHQSLNSGGYCYDIKDEEPRVSNIFNVLYSKICVLINNEPSKIPTWGINNLSCHLDKYTDEEIDHIYFCLLRFNDGLAKVNYLDINSAVKKTIDQYCYYRSFISWEFYTLKYPLDTKILRFYSTIKDFGTFYKRHGSYNLSDSFEFDLSNQELFSSKQGTWLLRKSSLSRSINVPEKQREEALGIIKKYLIEFYALTWKKSSGIYHIRFLSVPWKGWCVLKDPNSFDLGAIPPLFKGRWFVCFIDCLEYLLFRHNLNF